MKQFSLLISVYKQEHSSYLTSCFDSIYRQSLKPTEIILVEDGPLTPELYDAIANEKKRFDNIISIKLAVNGGLGAALNAGMQHCHYDLIARMDTDDICHPQRFEKQVSFMQMHPEIDVLSSWIDEFDTTPDHIVSTRKIPETSEEIRVFGKIRNPINHPAVIFRKQAVTAVGGYQPFPLFEDYFLWARMLHRGAHFYNIQQPLLLFRRSPEMIRRRGGVKYAKSEVKFQLALYKLGYISYFRMIKNILIRYGIRIVPNNIRNWFYHHFLRN